MFPELRAVQIEAPGDVLEMREGSDEAPAHEAGTLPRAVGFRPTTTFKSLIMGFLTLTGCGVAIFTVDLSERDLLLSTCFLEFHLEDGVKSMFMLCCLFSSSRR
jgi:hypothetical protein